MKFRWWFVSMGITAGLVLAGMVYLGSFLCLPVENNQCSSFQSEITHEISPQITTVMIPAGSEDPQSGKNYDPPSVTVVMGVNNTVQWINQSPSAANTITSDNYQNELQSPTAFQSPTLGPEKSWEHTFTQAGTYGYHGSPHPWSRGTVIVLSRPLEWYEKILP